MVFNYIKLHAKVGASPKITPPFRQQDEGFE